MQTAGDAFAPMTLVELPKGRLDNPFDGFD